MLYYVSSDIYISGFRAFPSTEYSAFFLPLQNTGNTNPKNLDFDTYLSEAQAEKLMLDNADAGAPEGADPEAEKAGGEDEVQDAEVEK